MSHYPTAHYEFGENEVHADGSQTVHCTVAIAGHARHMWLPVMDYKNKAIPNPNARDVSDTKMRCLVKTIAMFGLGFHIFQGQVQPEDTWDDSTEEAKEDKPVVQKPVAKKPAAKKPEPEPEADDEDFFFTDTQEGADHWVDRLIETVNGLVETKKGLRSIWEGNKKAVDKLQAEYPESYKRLADVMKAKQDELKKKESENG